MDVLGGRIVALSPHLDDAIFSIGALLAHAADEGAEVSVVTVLAGDPGGTREAAGWDRAAGFATEAEAARTRRSEDAAACAIIGATPTWLPHGDMTYGRGASDAEIVRELAPYADADVVFAPGFPLTHPDHEWLCKLAVRELRVRGTLAFYAEQPYTYHARPALGPPAARPPVPDAWRWTALASKRRHVARKARAVSAYRSQLPLLSDRRRLVRRVVRDEARNGGEAVAWPR